jgi:signal transduction histidine kinase
LPQKTSLLEDQMRTSFATADRVDAETLETQIKTVGNHPVISMLAKSIDSVFAVCNTERQILTANAELLNLLGIDDPNSVLGLRPGEALGCIYSHCSEGGCGTSEFCRSCGAAIAIVSSLETNQPSEQMCAITINGMNEKRDLYFKVRSVPFKIDEENFLLITMQDITRLQNLQAFERLFLHDISNLATSISGLSEFAKECEPEDYPMLIHALNSASNKLVNEIKLQKTLFNGNQPDNYNVDLQKVTVKEIFEDTVDSISSHPQLKGKKLRKPEIFPNKHFVSDKILLEKILYNLLLNAFEATSPGRAVRFWIDCGKSQLTFCVWNHKPVSDKVINRIFQRNYTTKSGQGHGQGTYIIKYIGESLLGGKVSFESSEDRGTVFKFSLPLTES